MTDNSFEQTRFQSEASTAVDGRPNYLIAGLFFLIPLVFYLSLIPRWSLSGDELFTLGDSSGTLSEIFRTQIKPIYYWICHFALLLPFREEICIRLPSAIAAALIAPTFYLFLWRPKHPWVAISAAVLALAQPWIFEFSQIGRFYTLTLWFVTIACISLYRWTSERRRKYLYLFIAFGALATFTHTTAFAIFPAGFVAVLAYDINSIRNNLTAKKIHFGIIAVVIGLALVAYPAFLSFSGYLGSNWGKFADYSIGSLVAAFVIFCGVQVWALAFLPMLRWPKQWSATERFWLIMFLAMFVPFICLAPFGGGIAPRFLFATLPCLIVLAAEHWQMVMNKINDKVLSAALGVGLLGVYLPQFVSTYVDGNHHDYRQAARFVESLALDDPMIASTAHGNLQHYLDGEFEIEELGVLQRINVEKTEEESFPRDVILRLIEKAESTRRPLVLVSREDRLPFHPGTRRWIGEHFSIIGIIERPRYDHRRNMLVVYEYRTDGGSD